MRDLHEWIKRSATEMNWLVVRYAAFVALVEYCTHADWRTWPVSWVDHAFCVVAWGGLLAAVFLRFMLYYGAEREVNRARRASEGVE